MVEVNYIIFFKLIVSKSKAIFIN
uniref:Uncharacterized protein n=1 Tax=Rhizophora mucronata TaxID=61149 RepID=A0A2P2N7E4_RHIMU